MKFMRFPIITGIPSLGSLKSRISEHIDILSIDVKFTLAIIINFIINLNSSYVTLTRFSSFDSVSFWNYISHAESFYTIRCFPSQKNSKYLNLTGLFRTIKEAHRKSVTI